MYQAQPQEPDEIMRYSFITHLIFKFPLWVDGQMLWSAMPYYYNDYNNSKEYEKYENAFMKPITQIYEQLTNMKRPLQIPRVLMKVKEFIQKERYKCCLDWIRLLSKFPHLPEKTVEILEDSLK